MLHLWTYRLHHTFQTAFGAVKACWVCADLWDERVPRTPHASDPVFWDATNNRYVAFSRRRLGQVGLN